MAATHHKVQTAVIQYFHLLLLLVAAVALSL
jgi:hypothetical protein